MTRKDYVLIAGALKAAKPALHPQLRMRLLEAWADTCLHIINALAADNPKFDRATFRKACGLGEEN